MQHPACRHVWHILRVRDTTGVTQVASSRFSFQTPGSSVTLLHLTIRCTRTCIRTRSGLTFDWLWLILRACCASRRRFDAREIEFLRARLKIRSMAFAHRTRRNSTHRPYPLGCRSANDCTTSDQQRSIVHAFVMFVAGLLTLSTLIRPRRKHWPMRRQTGLHVRCLISEKGWYRASHFHLKANRKKGGRRKLESRSSISVYAELVVFRNFRISVCFFNGCEVTRAKLQFHGSIKRRFKRSIAIETILLKRYNIETIYIYIQGE